MRGGTGNAKQKESFPSSSLEVFRGNFLEPQPGLGQSCPQGGSGKTGRRRVLYPFFLPARTGPLTPVQLQHPSERQQRKQALKEEAGTPSQSLGRGGFRRAHTGLGVALGSNPSSTFTSCVTLDSALNLSESQSFVIYEDLFCWFWGLAKLKCQRRKHFGGTKKGMHRHPQLCVI